MKKSIVYISTARPKTVGNSVIYSPLPASGMRQMSPFLMLDHLPPTELLPNQPFYVPPHPHRGFEPVTILFSGGIEHKDSAGNHGLLKSGAVQWTTAGSGIVHSEGTHPDLITTGTTMHLIQLWVNLPKAHKMTQPRYQDIHAPQIPVINIAENARLRLIAGEYAGQKAAINTFTPMLLIHGILEAGGRVEIDVPTSFNSALYTTLGALDVDGQPLENRQMAFFSQEGKRIGVSSAQGAEFLLLAGEPINEPLASYGPFVMNTTDEIQQAIRDYQEGKMGGI